MVQSILPGKNTARVSHSCATEVSLCQKNVTYLVSHSYYLLGISLTIRPLFKYCAIYPPSFSGFTSFQDHLKKKNKKDFYTNCICDLIWSSYTLVSGCWDSVFRLKLQGFITEMPEGNQAAHREQEQLLLRP